MTADAQAWHLDQAVLLLQVKFLAEVLCLRNPTPLFDESALQRTNITPEHHISFSLRLEGCRVEVEIILLESNPQSASIHHYL